MSDDWRIFYEATGRLVQLRFNAAASQFTAKLQQEEGEKIFTISADPSRHAALYQIARLFDTFSVAILAVMWAADCTRGRET